MVAWAAAVAPALATSADPPGDAAVRVPALPVQAEFGPLPVPDPDDVERGRRLYFGVEPREARLRGGSALPSGRSACVQCHRPSALGSFERGISVPAIAGQYLFRPMDPMTTRRYPWPVTLRTRPAYDETALAQLLAAGVAPDGHEVDESMPRYALSKDDVRDLSAFLLHFAHRRTAGVDDDTVYFATVTTPEAPPAEVAALLDTLNRFAADRSASGRGETRRRDVSTRLERLDYRVYRRWQVLHWALTGAPETWSKQLAALQAARPVFAVLGGLGYDQWAPVHAFCEAQEMPCVLPQVLDVATAPGAYSAYFDGGLQAQAREALRHWQSAQSASSAGAARTPLVVLGDAEPRTLRLQAMVMAALKDGGRAVLTAPPAKGPWGAFVLSKLAYAALNDESLINPAAGEARRNDSVRRLEVIYLPQFVADQQAPATAAAATAHQPQVYAVRSQLDGAARETRLQRARSWLRARKINPTGSAENVAANALFAATVALEMVGKIDVDFSREYAIERIESEMESMPVVANFERLSLGPGQRVASRRIRVVRH